MNIAVFGGFGKRMLASGWRHETVVALLGGGDFDLTGIVPGEDARLTVFAMFGGVDIVVDPGAEVRMSGFSLFGGREVEIAPGDSDVTFRVRAIAIFGGVTVKSAEPGES